MADGVRWFRIDTPGENRTHAQALGVLRSVH